MKKSAKPDLLPLMVLLLAVLGGWLRYWLYQNNVDEKGLLLAGHPAQWGLLVCTVLVVAAILMSAFRPNPNHSPLPLLSAFGHIWGAAAVLMTVLLNAAAIAAPFAVVWKYMGILAAAAMLYAAFPIVLGKTPFFGVYALICVFFAIHLVGHYRVWCSDPQLLNYVFSFLGTMALMVFSYECAAATLKPGKHRKLVFWGLLAVYCCLVAASGSTYLYLYLGSALWAICTLYGQQKGNW